MRSTTTTRGLRMAVAGAVAVLTLAACGDDTSTDSSASSTPTTLGDQHSAPGAGGAQGMTGGPGGGINGLVAEVDGDTAQVQSSTSQTAVTFTDQTTVTTRVTGKLADITVGSCVSVRTPGSSASTGNDSADSSSAAATAVSVSRPVDGECTPGFGGGGGRPQGAAPSGAPTSMPTDRPTDMPTDAPSGAPTGGPGGGRGDMITGKVTAVDGTTITVAAIEMTAPAQGGATDGSSDTTDPSTRAQSTTSTEVDLSGTVTVTVSTSGSTSDVVEGVCLQAQGEADSSGTVAATALTVSQAVDGSCTSGFGPQGGGSRGDAQPSAGTSVS